LIENPRTGEQVEFTSIGDDVLVMHSTWTRPGHRAVEHIHPSMEERFEVLDGNAAFLINGERFDAGPGDVVVAPAGARHLGWNPTELPVRLRIEMCPALRWEQFTRRLFAGEDPGHLLTEFASEIALPPEL